MKTTLPIAILSFVAIAGAEAELKLPAIVGDQMVLQQKQANPIWGWDQPGTEVKVSFGDQSKSAKADATGRWSVKLDPMPASADGAVLTISGTSKRELQDVVVGEVWMCSGQSNMAWPVANDWKFEVESLASNHPGIRLISVPQVGTQEMQSDFNGKWEAATPESVKNFSAVGFFYGRYLHEILGVPVGLIDNAWGGSAAEAWIRRDTIEKDDRFKALIDDWKQREELAQSDEAKEKHEQVMKKWKERVAKAKAEGKAPPRAPRGPSWQLKGNQRPGNIFAGVVHPTLGYGIKGVIWYQGESNSRRAWEYRELFPFMIEQWRKEWGQGDFPFYWVQLADFRDEQPEPGESTWAELREAQTGTMKLPNTGEAVIIDLGEGSDIHPKNKYDVAARLVRWALANDYGFEGIEPRSPRYQGVEITGNKATLSFDHVGGGLRTVDTRVVEGFAICGEDRQWVWAQAKITGNDKIQVWADGVEKPVAVRYAWADNPVCNVYAKNGLPLTPFRTDDFKLTTKPD